MMLMWARRVDHARAVANGALPISISYLAESAVLLTNIYIAGQLGALPLAIIGLGAGLLYPLTFAGAGLASTSSVLAASHPHSEGHKRDVLKAGYVIAIGVTPLLMASAFAFLYVLSFVNVGKELFDGTIQYLIVSSALIPLVFIFNIYRGILTVEGRTRPISTASYLSIMINAALAIILVFGLGWGIVGLGISTVVSMLFMVGYVRRTTTCWRATDREKVEGSSSASYKQSAMIARYLAVGTPIAFLGLLESGMFLALTGVAATFGVGFMAAHAIAIGISDFVAAFAFGIGEATTARLAAFHARGEQKKIRETYTVSLILIAFVATPLAIGVFVFQELIVPIMVGGHDENSARTISYFATISLTFSLFLIFDGIQSVQYRALKGIGDVHVPFLITTVGYWGVGVPLGSVLALYTTLGGHGVWVGLLIGVASSSLLLHLRSKQALSNPHHVE